MTEIDYTRKWQDTPPWPEHDPEPLVTSLDPVPADAPAVPASVKGLEKLAVAGGWEARVGYSLALLRGQKLSTYRLVQTFGVWLGPGHVSGWRALATYQRFADKTLVHEFDGAKIDPVGLPAGIPGTWTWNSVTIFSGIKRHQVLVTDLKEFLKVRGSVLPGWFTQIEKREAEKAERAKEAAKARPKKAKEEAL